MRIHRGANEGIPKVSNLHVQLGHPVPDLRTRVRFSIKCERRGLFVGSEIPANDEVRLTFQRFEFNFDETLLVPCFHKVLDFARPAQDLRTPNDSKL